MTSTVTGVQQISVTDKRERDRFIATERAVLVPCACHAMRLVARRYRRGNWGAIPR